MNKIELERWTKEFSLGLIRFLESLPKTIWALPNVQACICSLEPIGYSFCHPPNCPLLMDMAMMPTCHPPLWSPECCNSTPAYGGAEPTINAWLFPKDWPRGAGVWRSPAPLMPHSRQKPPNSSFMDCPTFAHSKF